MILVGICVHLPSVPNLAAALGIWCRAARPDVTIVVVFNGRLRPSIRRELAAAASRCAAQSEVVVRPTGHLSGFGPQRDAQEVLRQRALESGASHLLFHEVSRLPEDDSVLNELLAADQPVAGALYRDPHTLGQYCAFAFEPSPRESHRFGVVPEPLPEAPFSVPGIGFGLTLIRRDVLEAVPFRSGLHAADSFFAHDVGTRGFTIVAAPTIVWNSKVDGRPPVLAAWWAAHQSSPSYAS